MEPSENRAALRGMEKKLFEMVSKEATSTLWSKWLQPPLEQAIAGGDPDLVLALLEAGADASAGWRGCRGYTLLELAAKGGNDKIVFALLKAGGRAEINSASGDNGMLALRLAIIGGHTATARMLMVAGARVDWRDESERTALHLAAKYGDRELVEYILIARGHVGTQDSSGYTSLHYAANRGDCAIISVLLRAGADLTTSNELGLGVLEGAVYLGHIDAVEELLEAGADPNFVGGSNAGPPLFFARKSLAMTRLLLQYGASVHICDHDGLTPLHAAAGEPKCDSGVIDALIGAGAEVEARAFCEGRGTPLHYAAHARNFPGMEALLCHGADINAGANESPLHTVCSHCSGEHSVQAADFLLRRGADEMARDIYGRTANDVIEEGAGSAESMRRLLASAPADRAWRRRALLVLCRAFPDRLQHSGSEGEAAKVLCRGERVRTDAETHRGDENERMLVRVVGIEVEAIFRNIVVFL